nr:replication protein A 70 kDa DNA-binding subunit D-like isoform X1 [Coffea arabica]XP_027063367.1 replication protein A 70 kDa DNA-binding subunit D-like isoform X1 [Coffea arabica]XP_027063368.1 replication protein A 70 kDa DNA-binding subunit D-like isoform X1 [Coffea arabica]XP_027063369.1 replication protein A 70 kDa DNA-binding subunit D-like isoform X1 [Coffea arabica]XP_027063370.1 replication protein A 70 kDa DNA-binding subunit D-like isoform X1 [Coffea arabica]XP_027063371.1 repli
MFNKFIDIEGQQIAETINNFPVIICRRLKVKFFNGVTLSTRLDSTILVDPPAHEARQLKIWAGQNAVLFAQIIKEKSYTRYNPNLFLQSPQKFTLIFYLQPTQKRYWYMACKKCYKATDASHGHPYLCNKCSEYQEAVPRCRFDVNLADNTGNVTATLFGELAEKLLTYSALDAMQYFIRNVELPLEHVHEALKTKLFAVQIQPAQSRYGYLQQRYTVVHFYEENQGEENKSPSTSICINMASNFDETDNLGVTSPLAGFETAQISTTKKTKLALC